MVVVVEEEVVMGMERGEWWLAIYCRVIFCYDKLATLYSCTFLEFTE